MARGVMQVISAPLSPTREGSGVRGRNVKSLSAYVRAPGRWRRVPSRLRDVFVPPRTVQFRASVFPNQPWDVFVPPRTVQSRASRAVQGTVSEYDPSLLFIHPKTPPLAPFRIYSAIHEIIFFEHGHAVSLRFTLVSLGQPMWLSAERYW